MEDLWNLDGRALIERQAQLISSHMYVTLVNVNPSNRNQYLFVLKRGLFSSLPKELERAGLRPAQRARSHFASTGHTVHASLGTGTWNKKTLRVRLCNRAGVFLARPILGTVYRYLDNVQLAKLKPIYLTC